MFKIDVSFEDIVCVGCIVVILILLIVLFLVMMLDSLVLGLVFYVWVGFGVVFGFVLVLSLYWLCMNCYGVLLGIIVGGVMIVVWK